MPAPRADDAHTSGLNFVGLKAETHPGSSTQQRIGQGSQRTACRTFAQAPIHIPKLLHVGMGALRAVLWRTQPRVTKLTNCHHRAATAAASENAVPKLSARTECNE